MIFYSQKIRWILFLPPQTNKCILKKLISYVYQSVSTYLDNLSPKLSIFFLGGGGCCKIRPILLSIINLNQQHITDYKIDNAIFQIKTNIDQIPSS